MIRKNGKILDKSKNSNHFLKQKVQREYGQNPRVRTKSFYDKPKKKERSKSSRSQYSQSHSLSQISVSLNNDKIAQKNDNYRSKRRLFTENDTHDEQKRYEQGKGLKIIQYAKEKQKCKRDLISRCKKEKSEKKIGYDLGSYLNLHYYHMHKNPHKSSHKSKKIQKFHHSDCQHQKSRCSACDKQHNDSHVRSLKHKSKQKCSKSNKEKLLPRKSCLKIQYTELA